MMMSKSKGHIRGEHKISERLAQKLKEIKERKALENAASKPQKDYYRGPHVISKNLEAKIAENKARRAAADKLRQEKVFRHIKEMVTLHQATLSRNIKKSIKRDDYNNIIEDNRKQVVLDFLRATKIEYECVGAEEAVKFISSQIEHWEREHMTQRFDPDSYPEDGHQFEYWLAEALEKFGWYAYVTVGSGDQGVDVIAEKDGCKVAIQAKRYAGNVGNKAVQEVYSGSRHMGIKSAAVITTTGYTRSAVDLSNTTGVKLLFVNDIPKLYDLIKN
jgi:restriction system protein